MFALSWTPLVQSKTLIRPRRQNWSCPRQVNVVFTYYSSEESMVLALRKWPLATHLLSLSSPLSLYLSVSLPYFLYILLILRIKFIIYLHPMVNQLFPDSTGCWIFPLFPWRLQVRIKKKESFSLWVFIWWSSFDSWDPLLRQVDWDRLLDFWA